MVDENSRNIWKLYWNMETTEKHGNYENMETTETLGQNELKQVWNKLRSKNTESNVQDRKRTRRVRAIGNNEQTISILLILEHVCRAFENRLGSRFSVSRLKTVSVQKVGVVQLFGCTAVTVRFAVGCIRRSFTENKSVPLLVRRSPLLEPQTIEGQNSRLRLHAN